MCNNIITYYKFNKLKKNVSLLIMFVVKLLNFYSSVVKKIISVSTAVVLENACYKHMRPTLLKTSLSSMYLKMVTIPVSFSSKPSSLSSFEPLFNN